MDHAARLRQRNSHLKWPEAVAISIPGPFAHNSYTKAGRTVALTSDHHALLDSAGEPIAEVRSVIIESPKVQIVNAFLYPLPHIDAPVYAMEVVQFGPKTVVAVVDVIGLNGTYDAAYQARRILDQAHRDYPLPQSSDAPPWYQDCRSGLDCFCRPETDEQVRTFLAFDDSVWTHVLDTVRSAEPRAHAEAHRDALDEYVHHHRVNTPGLAFLQKGFGHAWTQRFLEQFFAAPERRHAAA